jgi:hypothetical protein
MHLSDSANQSQDASFRFAARRPSTALNRISGDPCAAETKSFRDRGAQAELAVFGPPAIKSRSAIVPGGSPRVAASRFS